MFRLLHHISVFLPCEILESTAEQQLSFLEGLKPGDQTVLEAFSFRKRSDVVFIYFAQTGAVGETQSESPQCHRKESRRAHCLNALYYY